MENKKLAAKLVNIMRAIKHVPKNGFNEFHRYHYATESDISDAVREAMTAENVIMLPDVLEHETREVTTKKGATEFIATVTVKYIFICGDTGEQISITGKGEGQDAGDKAIYKALTGAQKYVLLKMFQIPTGDDPEATNRNGGQNHSNNTKSQQQPPSKPQRPQQSQQPTQNQPEPEKPAGLASRGQVNKIHTLASDYVKIRGGEKKDVLRAAQDKAGVEKLKTIKLKEASAMIAELENWVNAAREQAKRA